MEDFCYLDFIEIKSPNNGACVILHSRINGQETINLTDGGYKSSVDSILSHLDKFYGGKVIDNMIVTHNDQDHCNGLIELLDCTPIKNLWILCPWLYANELMPYFKTYKSVPHLEMKLKNVFSNLFELYNKALDKKINILTPFQGSNIGPAYILSPSKQFFFYQIAASDRTPTSSVESGFLKSIYEAAISFIKALWGQENFDKEGTTSENEMSIVQFIPHKKGNFLLSGDAGVQALNEAITYIESNCDSLPPIKYFEVPHHGSRRNLSSDLMDHIFGKRINQENYTGGSFTAIAQASSLSEDHPRKAVIRAVHHRNGKILKVNSNWLRVGYNMPPRPNSTYATSLSYPDDMEE